MKDLCSANKNEDGFADYGTTRLFPDEYLVLSHPAVRRHRRGRKAPAIQDGRQLRRYKRRWKIERLWAWLHNYRRIATRWDWHLENYTGWVHLGAIIILLRRLVPVLR